MTNTQFEILDELYFIITYQDLLKELDFDKLTLNSNLEELINKGWVKCFKDEIELELSEVVFQASNLESYSFLATKKGLFAHNSR